MRWPRVRLSLRTLMLAILAFGLVFGYGGYLRNRERLRTLNGARNTQQLQATQAILQEISAEVVLAVLASVREAGPGDTPSFHRAGPYYSNEAGWGLRADEYHRIGGEEPTVFRVDIRGGSLGDAPEPIVVRAFGGPRQDQVLDRLTRGYRERGWPCRVIREKPESWTWVRKTRLP